MRGAEPVAMRRAAASMLRLCVSEYHVAATNAPTTAPKAAIRLIPTDRDVAEVMAGEGFMRGPRSTDTVHHQDTARVAWLARAGGSGSGRRRGQAETRLAGEATLGETLQIHPQIGGGGGIGEAQAADGSPPDRALGQRLGRLAREDRGEVGHGAGAVAGGPQLAPDH